MYENGSMHTYYAFSFEVLCLMNTNISNDPVDGGGAPIGPDPAILYPSDLYILTC